MAEHIQALALEAKNARLVVLDGDETRRVRRRLTKQHLQRLKAHSYRYQGLSVLEPDDIDNDLAVAGALAFVDLPAWNLRQVAVTALGRTLLAAEKSERVAARSPHEELIAKLVEHLAPRIAFTSFEFALEHPLSIADGRKRANAARPDVLSFSGSLDPDKWNPVVHEVKVSRADALADLRTGKWQVYREFCERLVFVCPEGVMRPADVPAGCGLLSYDGTDWTMLRRGRKLAGRPSTKQMMKLLLHARTAKT